MQSLDIKRPAKPTSRVVVSAILIDCPAVITAATTIPSNYSAPTILTNYSTSTALDPYRC
jgi:hypothetical protein